MLNATIAFITKTEIVLLDNNNTYILELKVHS